MFRSMRRLEKKVSNIDLKLKEKPSKEKVFYLFIIIIY